MKLLLFSDLHCDVDAARSLVQRSADVDVVVGAGDFATMRQGIEKTIDVLKSIECPAVLVAGNGESEVELAEACSSWASAQVLHGSGTTIDDVAFYGLGAAVPITPFGSWSYDLSEEQAQELLRDCPAGCVLISHSPPYQAADLDTSGKNLGSVSVRECVEQKKPRLVVCGHVHASWGTTEEIGPSPVVNAGPRGMMFELK